MIDSLKAGSNIVEDTMVLVSKLFDSHSQAMGEEANKFFSGMVEDVYEPRHWFSHILDWHCQAEDLTRLNVHGITRGEERVQLQSLLTILKGGELKGSWAPLRGSGYVDAYTTGGFTLVSPMDEGLVLDNGELNVGVVVVNPYFIPLMSTLKEMYPQHTFIKAENFPAWVDNQKKKGD